MTCWVQNSYSILDVSSDVKWWLLNFDLMYGVKLWVANITQSITICKDTVPWPLFISTFIDWPLVYWVQKNSYPLLAVSSDVALRSQNFDFMYDVKLSLHMPSEVPDVICTTSFRSGNCCVPKCIEDLKLKHPDAGYFCCYPVSRGTLEIKMDEKMK